MTSMKLAISVTIMSMIYTNNPVKLSFQLMIFSALIFFIMFLESSKCWFPIIYFMLFMGGILIMFMILSSLLPNEVMSKPQNKMEILSKIFFLTMFLTFLSSMKNLNQMESELISQLQMVSSSTIIFMMILIFLYFLIFMSCMEFLKLPLKSQVCH